MHSHLFACHRIRSLVFSSTRISSHLLSVSINFIMPTQISLEDEFVKQVENEEARFDEDICSLDEDQLEAFQSCCGLFREDAASLEKRSTAQRYRILRVRKLLQQVFLHLGAEVFLLCILATSITGLAKLDRVELHPKLRRWWKGVVAKRGLIQTAQKLCADNSVSGLIEHPVTDYTGQQKLFTLRDHG